MEVNCTGQDYYIQPLISFICIHFNFGTAICGLPSLPINGYIAPYTSTLERATVMYICWNVHRRGHQSQCEKVNMTAVCNEHGYWEPSTDDICAEPTAGKFRIIVHTISSS